jgi:replicative DNA helicase
MFDRDPPHSLEAEMSLLGCLLLDPQRVADVLPVVRRAEDFYAERHGAIYRAILDAYDRRAEFDAVLVGELLKARGVLEDIGGMAYLADLAESVPASVNAPHYARIVADKARLRRLIDSAGSVLYDAYNPGEAGIEGAKELIDRAQAEIFEIAEEEESSDAMDLKELLHAEIERIDRAGGEGISGIHTGFGDLDDLLSGLQKGEMLILAARPSMGKTAFALNLSEQIALGGRSPWQPDHGKRIPVAVFSLEMSKNAVAQRLLSAHSGVDGHRLRTGQISADDFHRVAQSCGVLSETPLYIDDTPALTILGLRTRARRLVRKHGVGVIVIDYLQLLSSPSAARESRQNEVSAISRGIKALARELNLPIICLAQLNRATEQREGNRPRMSDLRESGSIEQDADVVMLLHREEYYHINNPEWKDENPDKVGVAEVIIAKQRNGPTGVVKLTWDSRTTRFKNYDAHTDTTYGGGYGFGAPASGYGAQRTGYNEPKAGASASSGGGGGAPFSDPPFGTSPFAESPAGDSGRNPAGEGATPRRAAFAPGKRSGPEAGFRDGGGPDRDAPMADGGDDEADDSSLPPF